MFGLSHSEWLFPFPFISPAFFIISLFLTTEYIWRHSICESQKSMEKKMLDGHGRMHEHWRLWDIEGGMGPNLLLINVAWNVKKFNKKEKAWRKKVSTDLEASPLLPILCTTGRFYACCPLSVHLPYVALNPVVWQHFCWCKHSTNVTGVTNNFLLGFKAHITRWIHTCHCYQDEQPMARQVIGHRGHCKSAILTSRQ